MKKFLIFTLLLISSSFYAQEVLTLEEAIQTALNRNVNLTKSENSIAGYKSSVKSAYGNFLPNLNTSGSFDWQRTSDDGGGTQIDFFGNETIIEASTRDTRNYSVYAGGSWTLFNGLANFANLSQSKKDLEAARYNLDRLKREIVYQTTEYYYNVLFSKELLDVRKDNVAYNQKFLETIQERNRLGSVAIADVYTQQVATGRAELLLVQAENSLEQAKSVLLNYLALDVLEDYEFVQPEDSEDVTEGEFLQEFKSIREMVNFALDNRLDFKGQKLNVEAADAGITIASGNLYPSLSGDYSFYTSAVKSEDLFNRRVYGLGLSLNFPIFSNWNTEEQVQYAKVSWKNAQEDLSALERQIKIEVKQGYLDLVAGKKQLEVSRNNVTAAEENRRVNNERYNLGSGTILDVLQSDKDYTQALSDRLDALYNYYILKDRLKSFLGILEYKSYQ